MTEYRTKDFTGASAVLSNISIMSVEEGALDTSRSREFDLRGVLWTWVMDSRPTKEILRFNQFQSIITEETLSVGNISTHISLRFNWGALTKGIFPVVLKVYNKSGGGWLYDLSLPSISFDCGQGAYNSGLIKLPQNHFDIISRVSPDFPQHFQMSGEHPCDE